MFPVCLASDLKVPLEKQHPNPLQIKRGTSYEEYLPVTNVDGSGHQDPLTTDLPGRHHSPWKARKEEPA